MKFSLCLILITIFANPAHLQAKLTCEHYLNPQNLTKRRKVSLRLKPQNLPSALKNILAFKLSEIRKLDIHDFANYLSINNVNHSVSDGKIFISSEGQSPLNRFTRWVAKVSQKRNEQSPTGVTEVVFDPEELGYRSLGAFQSEQTFKNSTSELLMAKNFISLSIEAILQLKPTTVELHELTHWHAYFDKANLDVASISHGWVYTGGGSHSSAVDKVDKDKSYSLEELQAHMLDLTKALRRFNSSSDPDEREDYAFTITQEMSTLYRYAIKIKPLVEQFIRRSIFSSKDFEDDFRVSDAGAFFEVDLFDVLKFDWMEQVRYIPGQGSFRDKGTLGYHFFNFQDSSWIYVIMPLPESMKSLSDFRQLQRPENQQAFRDISQSIYLKMSHLWELIAYIETLNQQVTAEEFIEESPVQKFHDLNRQLQHKLNNL